jgi:hypothetical protein
MAQTSTTALSALPLAPQDGAVTLQATEKNVVVANMAAELAAKRDQEAGTSAPGHPAGGVVMGSGAGQPLGLPPSAQPGAQPSAQPGAPVPSGMAPQSLDEQAVGGPPPRPSPHQQANFARGVASAAATGALGLPARDVVAHPGGVVADPTARPLHTPQPPHGGQDYIAEMEHAQRMKAQAAAQRRPTAAHASTAGIAGDAAVQAAAIAALLFLISQLPATRAIASSVFPKLFNSSPGGLTTAGATALALIFGVAYYAATIATSYLSA